MRLMIQLLCFLMPVIYAATPLTEIHPNYDMSSVRPEGWEYSIGGFDWFSDGRMVVATYHNATFGEDGDAMDVWVIHGTETGDNAQVAAERYSQDLDMIDPLGLAVVDDVVYVVHKHQLSRLIDANDDGMAESKETVATWSDIGNFHQFDYGLLYDEGFFYATLNAAWQPTQEGKDRASLIKIDETSGDVEVLSSGLRSPAGLGWGPEGEIFAPDNQGEWMPANKINNLREGRFYGLRHPDDGYPFEDGEEYPPVVWLPQGDIANSPTQPLMLTSGTFAGQLLVGDIHYGGVQRVFLEKVNDEWQGSLFRFAGGFESGIFRMSYGPDGAIYAAGLGGPGGNWRWNTQFWALHRIEPNGSTAFEMLAVRSRQGGLEIEFTTPVGTGADVAGNFTVRQWGYTSQAGYGAGRHSNEDLSVSSAEVSSDNMRVFLNIANLKADRLVHIELDGVMSETGQEVYEKETWYTQNFISDSQKFDPIIPVDLGDRVNSSAGNKIPVHAFNRMGGVELQVNTTGHYTLSIVSLMGKTLRQFKGWDSGSHILRTGALSQGIYIASLEAGGRIHSVRIPGIR